MSTFTAISTTLLGVLTGHWIFSERTPRQKVKGLIFAGLVCLITGYVWGRFFLISRNIWSSSFVLYAGGWSLLSLALFYWIIDIKGFRKWSSFLIVIGMNAITIWFGQRCINFNFTAEFLFNGMIQFTGVIKPILAALSVLTVKWLFLYFLHRNKIYLKA
jgi:hypothetical protein